MTAQHMHYWLKTNGFSEVQPRIFESADGETRFELRIQTFTRREKLSANRWGAAKSHKYIDRRILPDGRLGYTH